MLPTAQQELRVPLTWTDGQGLTVTKTFVFTRGWYSIDLHLRSAQRQRDGRAALASYGQILRHWEHASRSYFDVETYSFKGPGGVRRSKSRDLNVESEADSKFSETITNGWLASLQHHFVSAIVPPAGPALRLPAAGPGSRVPAERDRPVHSRSPPGASGAVPRKAVRRARNCSRSSPRPVRASIAPSTTAF